MSYEKISKEEGEIAFPNTRDSKDCSPPMRLTYSQVYFYETKFNLIGWNDSRKARAKCT